ncbi:carboxy terminal-processing peptidase [Dongshaea marina]|uniref:carboxy terminal-processing peptidase n=1 Tax=Dongshaea marina TaxID=2047966 RepID=UPI000D3E0853|nr:carboxy terminal-processing peptidase [Dongshaea marina]
MTKCFLRSLVIVCGIVLYGFSAQAATPPYKESALPHLAQEPQHSAESKRIAAYFTRVHYKHVLLNDALSQKIFDRYLNFLDYRHWIFLQSDIDSFKAYRDTLDDEIERGQLSGAYLIFNTYIKRRYERLSYALSLLDKPLPLNTPAAAFELDREKAPWAKSRTELDKLWYKRVRYDELNLALAGKKWPEIQKILTKRYSNALKFLKQSESEDVFFALMSSFAHTIDPHTDYLSPRRADQFSSNMNISIEGIGAVLQAEDDYTVIRSLVPGGPAARSKKLRAEDKIIGVAQECGKMVDVVGWRLDDVVDLIKGPRGSKLCLQIQRGEGAISDTHVVKLERDKVRLEDRAAKSKLLTVQGEKVGLLEIPGFYVDLHQDVEKQLLKLKKQGMQSLVVDLRSNGGGLLTEAVDLTGLFIKQGPVVQIRNNQGDVEVEKDKDPGVVYTGPMVVLIDRLSASASEIFAAAMQDYGRAVILGQDSFGKGTVQQYRSLGRIYDFYHQPMGYVKYTISKFYRINGGSTQDKGVMPDIILPPLIDASKVGESVEKNALPWDRIKPLDYRRSTEVSKLLPELKALHAKRVKSDPEYKELLQEINLYRKESMKTSISLVESERLKQKKLREQKVLALTNSRLERMGKKPISKLSALPADLEMPDYYQNEATEIAADLAKLESATG